MQRSSVLRSSTREQACRSMITVPEIQANSLPLRSSRCRTTSLPSFPRNAAFIIRSRGCDYKTRKPRPCSTLSTCPCGSSSIALWNYKDSFLSLFLFKANAPPHRTKGEILRHGLGRGPLKCRGQGWRCGRTGCKSGWRMAGPGGKMLSLVKDRKTHQASTRYFFVRRGPFKQPLPYAAAALNAPDASINTCGLS